MSLYPEWRERAANERAACSECGRAHQPGPECPPPPRDYHDAPFLKKYGG